MREFGQRCLPSSHRWSAGSIVTMGDQAYQREDASETEELQTFHVSLLYSLKDPRAFNPRLVSAGSACSATVGTVAEQDNFHIVSNIRAKEPESNGQMIPG